MYFKLQLIFTVSYSRQSSINAVIYRRMIGAVCVVLFSPEVCGDKHILRRYVNKQYKTNKKTTGKWAMPCFTKCHPTLGGAELVCEAEESDYVLYKSSPTWGGRGYWIFQTCYRA